MSLVSVTVAANEIDILEAFARYHAGRLVDRMVIVLHRCDDGSEEILRGLQGEGLPIEIRTDMQLEHRQGERVGEVIQDLLAGSPPAWILPLDADEFLMTTSGANPRDAILALPRDRVWLVPWRTYLPLATDDPRELDVFRRIRHRRRTELSPSSKILIPSALLEGKSWWVHPGNHFLSAEEDGRQLLVPSEESPDLRLAHFPVRSPRQLAGKILRGWLRNVARPEKDPQDNIHWRILYERLQRSPTLSFADLETACLYDGRERILPTAKRVVLDPFAIPEEVTRTIRWRGTTDDALLPPILAEGAVEAAEAYAHLSLRYREKLRFEDNDREMERMRNSRSWRWTAPLRRLEPRLRSLLRRRRKELHTPESDTSQHGEISLLRTILPRSAPRFLVDVGAHDGTYLSNSLPFIRNGWSGVLIEPHPTLFQRLRDLHADNPDVQCREMACTDQSGPCTLYESSDAHHSMNTLRKDHRDQPNAREITVHGETLTRILEDCGAPAEFSLLLIDAEGADEDVLRGLDITRYRPLIILTEDHREAPQRDRTKHLLLEQYGYTLFTTVGCNSVWTRGDG